MHLLVCERAAVGVLVEHHAERQVRRVQAHPLEIVAELLDARLVLDLGVRVLHATGPVGRVLPGLAVHHVQVLGHGVPGLEVLVQRAATPATHRRGARSREVLGTETEQGRAVELGVAPDVVVLLGGEL